MLVAFVLAWLLPCAFCASESMGAAPGTVLHAEGKNTQLVTALVFVGMFLLVLLYAFIDCWCSRSKSKKRANDEGNSEEAREPDYDEDIKEETNKPKGLSRRTVTSKKPSAVDSEESKDEVEKDEEDD
uniref:Uncharacterized protein n=1 Tax=Euplotes harpa TaxID=151035 RepID=A0A7S3J136_9SPIT